MSLAEVAVVVSILNGSAALALAVIQLRDRWRRRK
jgi:hypothetical protein